jgi:hypothetical protein
MSHPDADIMYVNVPKNASSWTKPNLLDFGWEFYNYHDDGLNKHALVVLRDPVERWLSGIAEYLVLWQPRMNNEDFTHGVIDIFFDRICFDDHTELQVKFLHGLDTNNCTFFWCDEHYRANFSQYMSEYSGKPNKYYKYDYQHVSETDQPRNNFKELFRNLAKDSGRMEKIKNYFEADYNLINQVKFYGTR